MLLNLSAPFIMKWQQQSNVYKPHRPMMHIMKVMKDIVSMIQKRFEKYDLIIADELGYISFDREATDLLFTVLSLRASQKSTIITSNPTFERWDEIFEDAAITSAIVDRLTYGSS